MKTLKQKIKSLLVCALVACGAVVSAQANSWTYSGNASSGTLTDTQDGWTLRASIAFVDGANRLTVTGYQTAPEGESLTLDMTGEITGLPDGIKPEIYFIDSYYAFQTLKIVTLKLPNTLARLSGNAFSRLYVLETLEPLFPQGLIQMGGVETGNQAANYMELLNPGLTSVGSFSGFAYQQVVDIYLGENVATFGDYSFDCINKQSYVNLYLTGSAVPTFGSGVCRGASVRLYVPVWSTAWDAELEAKGKAIDPYYINLYKQRFGDDLVPVCQYNGFHVFRYVPQNMLYVESNIDAAMGVVTSGDETVRTLMNGVPSAGYANGTAYTLTMPETAVYNGTEYRVTGYTLETLGETGWGAPVNKTGNTYSWTADGTTVRITWKWAASSCSFTVKTPSSGVGTVSVSPALPSGGTVTPGSTYTLTATPGEGWNSTFKRWYGDVPAGHEKDNPLVITVEDSLSIMPYFENDWVDSTTVESAITDGYWTLKVSGTETLTLGTGAVLDETAEFPFIDLSKPISGGRTITKVNADIFPAAISGLERVRLPLTVTDLNGTFAKNLRDMVQLELLMPSLTYLGWQFGGGYAANKCWIFNENLTGMEQYAFDCLGGSGPVDVRFTGNATQLPSNNGNLFRAATIARICVPYYAKGYDEYLAGLTAPTAEQQMAYDAVFNDGIALLGVGNNSQSPNYNGVYFAKWAPEEFCKDAVHVLGNVPAGEVVPAYGTLSDAPSSVGCSAPAAATYQGTDYSCRGYVLETLGDDGWENAVTNLGVNAFTLNREGSQAYRVTWLWAEAGFAADVTIPESGVIGAVDFSPEKPAGGGYAPGTVVTITAHLGEGWSGEFDYWQGNVPAGHEKDNPLTLTMNEAYSLTPIFKSCWKPVEGQETSQITDGYWILRGGYNANGDFELWADCMNGATQPCPIDMMDLRKNIEGGKSIVKVGDYAFRKGDAKPFQKLRLSDKLYYIGYSSFQNQSVASIEPCMPASLTTLGGAFNTGDYVGELYLTNPKYTEVARQMWPNSKVTKAVLGVGVTNVNNYAFDYFGGDKLDIYFNGDVPVFGISEGYNTQFRGVNDQRIFVPAARWGLHADWTTLIETEATPITDAQLSAYETKFGESEPKPIAKWRNQYLLRFKCPYDKEPGMKLIFR